MKSETRRRPVMITHRARPARGNHPRENMNDRKTMLEDEDMNERQKEVLKIYSKLDKNNQIIFLEKLEEALRNQASSPYSDQTDG